MLARDPDADPFGGRRRSEGSTVTHFQIAVEGIKAFSLDGMSNSTTFLDNASAEDRYTIERYSVNLPVALFAGHQKSAPSLPFDTISGSLDLCFALGLSSGGYQGTSHLVMDDLGVIKGTSNLSGITKGLFQAFQRRVRQAAGKREFWPRRSDGIAWTIRGASTR